MIDCCFSSSVVGVRVLGTTIVRCWCVVSSCNTGSRKISPLHSSFEPIIQCFQRRAARLPLVLVHSQPPNTHTELTTTRNYWQLTHQRYTALRSGLDLPRHKKHRVIGTNLSFSLSGSLFCRGDAL